MTSFTILLTCTPLNLPMASYLYAPIFIYDHLWEPLLFMRIFWISSYLWSSVRIFPFYENLFESLLIYDHLWESLLFMRIFLNLFLFMIICENLSLLWESFLIFSFLSQSFFIITIFFNYHNLFESLYSL